MAILDSFLTEGEWAYGMTPRNSSRASFKSCIRLLSRALMLNRTALPCRFFLDVPLELVLAGVVIPPGPVSTGWGPTADEW